MLCSERPEFAGLLSRGTTLRVAVGEHDRELPAPRRALRRTLITLDFEQSRHRGGFRCVIGIDEAGIGPWAGPVVAAAVWLDPEALPEGLADSKALSSQNRRVCYEDIMRLAKVGVGIADVTRIDRDNVLRASHWAMGEAVRALSITPDLAAIDGVHAPDIGCAVETIIGGDAIIASIAAASIVAKVTRDRLMQQWATQYPGYGFERHVGYGTAEHRAAIAALGVTPIHRRSFRPIQVALEKRPTTTEG